MTPVWPVFDVALEEDLIQSGSQAKGEFERNSAVAAVTE
jgi:hypothetical protein